MVLVEGTKFISRFAETEMDLNPGGAFIVKAVCGKDIWRETGSLESPQSSAQALISTTANNKGFGEHVLAQTNTPAELI